MKKLKYKGKSGADLNTKYNEKSFDLPPADDLYEYKELILERISFVKIFKSFKLRPEDCLGGRYTHRMVCPFKFHKNGRERTGSFRFNEKKKTFTCFGCNTSGDILKFLQLYVGGDEQYHLEKLAAISGLLKDGEIQVPSGYKLPSEEPIKETNHRILFDAGLLLRSYLLELKEHKAFIKECEWADKMLEKLDESFASIEEDNMEDAKIIYDALKIAINKRKNKIIA